MTDGDGDRSLQPQARRSRSEEAPAEVAAEATPVTPEEAQPVEPVAEPVPSEATVVTPPASREQELATAQDALTRDAVQPQPLPAEPDSVVPGYTKFTWGGADAYRCNYCQYDTTELENILLHVEGNHLGPVERLALKREHEQSATQASPVITALDLPKE